MTIYVETSAILRELLEGNDAEEIRRHLGAAKIVATSRLTLAEVGRVMARLRVLEPSVAGRIASREANFWADTELWYVLPIDEAVLARSARPFPIEPVRTLDAIHLATAEVFSSGMPHLQVLSTDERIRQNANAMGFATIP